MSAQVIQCPRCGDWTLEVFRTHKYCACCNFSSLELESEKPVSTRALRSVESQPIQSEEETTEILVTA